MERVFEEAKRKMDVSLEHLAKEFSGVRTGRASVGLLDGIEVDYYGAQTPLNQAANISTPDALTIAIQPWEQKMIPVIEKAIMASDLGLTPANDGKVIRINIPPLTEQRRKELVKHVRKIAEDARIAMRNVRRDCIEKIKKLEKDKEVSEDEARKGADTAQKIIDEHIEMVDKMTADKEKEIMAR
ncbi:MAG: ribosome recycling factor [Candidatus Nitrospinota bacterium M3_3B_026]